MSTARIKIKPNVVEYYIERSTLTVEELEEYKDLKNLAKWMDSQTQPTFNQLNKLSKVLKVPFGYLLLNEIQDEKVALAEYRTILNEEIPKPSSELIDTIHDMENKQSWLKDYLQRTGAAKLDFVGIYKQNTDTGVIEIAKSIRAILGIEENWFSFCRKANAYNYLRNKFEQIGITVMMNGIAKSNTKRTLRVDEFRAFVLVDELAPLIFINTSDSDTGKIFSLFHEMAHIVFGESGIFNENHEKNPIYRNELEIKCNNIASELCLPTHLFQKYWAESIETNVFDKIELIANKCNVSQMVIGLKALKRKFITEEDYNEIRKRSIENYENSRQKKKSGGDAINNAVSRIDKRFFRLLSADIKNGYTPYTEAYRLMNTNRKTFDKIEQRIVGGNY